MPSDISYVKSTLMELNIWISEGDSELVSEKIKKKRNLISLSDISSVELKKEIFWLIF